MTVVRRTRRLCGSHRCSARKALITSGLLVPYLFGCASDDATILEEMAVAQPTTNESESGESASGAGAEGPYVATLEVAVPDGEQNYTARLPTMAALTDDGFRRGIELGQPAVAHDGSVFVASADSPTMTKFGIDPTGAFVEEARLSFAGVGATEIGRFAITEGKAYALDQQRRLIAWDPVTMELTGGVVNLQESLAQLAPDWSPTIGILRVSPGDGRLFVPVSLRRVGEYGDEFRLSATLVVVDTNTDEIVRIAEDNRICDSIYSTVTDSGDLYVYTGALGVLRQGAFGDSCPGGVLRVRSGEETFDPDFYVNLDDSVGGRPATQPGAAGGASILFRAYHGEFGPIAVEQDWKRVEDNQDWRYWRFDLEGGAEPELVADLPATLAPSQEGYFWIPEERRFLVSVIDADRTTRLYERTEGGFTSRTQLGGRLQSFERTR